MTVRELIEALEDKPLDMPVVIDGNEVTEILVREEMYLTSDNVYEEGIIVKLY